MPHTSIPNSIPSPRATTASRVLSFGMILFVLSGVLLFAVGDPGVLPGATVPTAPSSCTTFTDVLETGAPGWTFDPAVIPPDSPPWALSNDPNTTLPTNHSFFSSATTLQGPAGVKDDRVVSPSLDLSSTSVLTFSHRYSLENTFDGGVLEISTDGGSQLGGLGPVDNQRRLHRHH